MAEIYYPSATSANSYYLNFPQILNKLHTWFLLRCLALKSPQSLSRSVSDEILVPLLSRAWRARTQTWSLQKKTRSFGWNFGPAFLQSMKGEDPGFLNLWNLELILRNLKFWLKLTRLYYPSLSWFKSFLFKTGFQTSQVRWSPRVLFAKPEVFTVVKTCVTAMAIKYSLKAWTFSYKWILLRNRTFYDFSKFSHHEVYNSEFLLPGDIYII